MSLTATSVVALLANIVYAQNLAISSPSTNISVNVLGIDQNTSISGNSVTLYTPSFYTQSLYIMGNVVQIDYGSNIFALGSDDIDTTGM